MSEKYEFEGPPFKGIIAHLRKECGGNVHLKGVLEIRASSEADNSRNCYQVTDDGWDGYWYTQSWPGSWICFDFKDKCVCVTGYSLKTHSVNDTEHLIQWVVEVSNNASDWVSVDSRNTKDMMSRGCVATFSCQNPNTEKARYVRLRQTGKNGWGQDNLILTQIELFGTIFRTA